MVEDGFEPRLDGDDEDEYERLEQYDQLAYLFDSAEEEEDDEDAEDGEGDGEGDDESE
ncbi:MAG: hypothetical protein LBM75_01695 [Myxococcales bacterium]|nr:hypothetical protein [Myxococcales bacterium]